MNLNEFSYKALIRNTHMNKVVLLVLPVPLKYLCNYEVMLKT